MSHHDIITVLIFHVSVSCLSMGMTGTPLIPRECKQVSWDSREM